MNEELSAFFDVPVGTMMLAIAFPAILLPTPNRLITNRWITIQQWLIQLIMKQLLSIHNTKGLSWSLMLITLTLFIGLTNLLGLLPYSFAPTTQLTVNLSMAIPLWTGTVVLGFRYKTKMSLAHLLPQGTPTFLIPMIIIIETISLLIRPVTLAVRLTANITAGHLLIHLTGTATLTLLSIHSTTITVTFVTVILLTILELAVALIQAYVFALLISLYLHESA
uniref:ATP synthase subunit a n=1 Tax=Loxodonta cyclotis TaxID=99490 RepID=H6UP98_LOXCY|nr:ATP synthase F0 subunit 6 [Loxodonta cyclotis]AEQ59306.1 ATP synthase F0 subunit 6 [Loxodonta cyclotis]QRM17568.1 ATP synthase F0 subunit 6 [Loxodonta cyclotis]QSJ48892.1 ATP synthase F0 subunit 6 [Loxodonta cyclotis]QSJ48918.1 ATP synthase F0 subunit 6 [Loxodonta cyclotis]QSJ48944.1 ATP synthase F0 subunit 6 [Loxodonta cyclotis]